MDVIKKINQLMEERNWSRHKLSVASGLSVSTISNIFRRNTIPSLSTLEAICGAFGITLSQFFLEDYDSVPLTLEQKDLYSRWVTLTDVQKKLIYELIKEMR